MAILIQGLRWSRIALNAMGICIAVLCCSGASAQGAQRGAGAIATIALDRLSPGILYWHLDTFPNRALAELESGRRGAVAESFGKVWLFTIADASWRPGGGVHVATIGPLPIAVEGSFTATFLSAATMPGFQTDIHQHGGPEALYTISGEVCLETPQGKVYGRAGGEPVLIPGNLPMRLTSVGTEERRSIVLVLHDSSQPWKVPATGWAPKGLCSSN